MIAARYHEATKHHFNRFARSLGYLDWVNQPDPFRRYSGASVQRLPRVVREPSSVSGPSASVAADVPFSSLYEPLPTSKPFDQAAIGEFLRCSMGLSAWKEYGQSRWALRVNPSSGNLHPTEAWIVHDGRVLHYAPKEHALEERCVFQPPVGRTFKVRPTADYVLVALTSIIWREAWKYGERAFRYCQHDVGHAIGALRFSAARLGWRLRLLPDWSDSQIAELLGLDREQDYQDAEREEPECLALVERDDESGVRDPIASPEALVAAIRDGSWSGRANRLSAAHVDWPLIDEVTAATRYRGRTLEPRTPEPRTRESRTTAQSRTARSIILQRRSALSFDPAGVLERATLLDMLGRLHPVGPPWDAIHWEAYVHLVLFIHRVRDLVPGIYAYFRDASAVDASRHGSRRDAHSCVATTGRSMWLVDKIFCVALR